MRSLVRLLAVATIVVIGLSLALFAIDQSTEGRDTQVREVVDSEGAPVRSREAIDAPNPGPDVERVRESVNSSARELIDDGNDVLASPFTSLAWSDHIWTKRMVPAVVGLLLFGLGGLMLANWIPEKRREHQDWREAAS